MSNTIAENLTRLQTARTAIASAITAKGGTVTSGDGFEDFPTDIATIPTEQEDISVNDVTFYDYDGTIVTTYSKADFLALSAMPANPTHEGLTSQGWNWSLADAKEHVNEYGSIVIGQSYTTSDGKTRLIIVTTNRFLAPTISLIPSSSGSITVDWGDGSETDVITGTGVKKAKHNYAEPGKYTITISGKCSGRSTIDLPIVENAFIGDDFKLGQGAFVNQCNMKTASIPTSIGEIALYSFQLCRDLRAIIIPEGVAIGIGAFEANNSMVVLSTPKSITSLGIAGWKRIMGHNSQDGNFGGCYSIRYAYVPQSVTNLTYTSFQGCLNLEYIRFMGQNPPQAPSSATFAYLPTDCIIYVPSGSLEDYEDETNYPDPDVYTYVEY